MSKINHEPKHDYQKKSKKVFLSSKKNSSFICGECSLFTSQEVLIDYKQIELYQKKKYDSQKHKYKHNQIQASLVKSCKKSLKSKNKNKTNLTNTAPSHFKYQFHHQVNSQSLIAPLNQISQSFYSPKNNQNTLSTSLNPSIFISRSSSGHIIPIIVKNQRKSQNGFFNNLTSNHKENYINHRNVTFINIPMVQSIKHEHIRNSSSGEKIFQKQNFTQYKVANFNANSFNKINYLNSSKKTNLDYLTISPVRIPTVLQEESSKFNSQDITQRNQVKIEQISKCPPLLNKNISDHSQIKQNIALINPLIQQKSNCIEEKHSFGTNQFQKKNDIDNIFQKIQDPLDNGKLQKDNELIDDQIFTIKWSKKNSMIFQQQMELNQQNTYPNETNIQTNSIKAQNYSLFNQIRNTQNKMNQIQQQELIKKIQAKQKQPKVFGRHSAQLPKLKRLNTFKVRKTISLRDQQSSSQQQTSEVVYGFRKINNMEIMEDIQQDMQQSIMTKLNFKKQQNSNFHKF